MLSVFHWRLTLSDIARAATRAKEILKVLKQKHPRLDAYLVVSSPLGQARVDSSLLEFLREFPALFLASEDKEKALTLLGQLDKSKEPKPSSEELASMIRAFDIDPSVQIELRFGELRYDLIWDLQKDPLVDKTLTPQSKASIRIVIGTIATLA